MSVIVLLVIVLSKQADGFESDNTQVRQVGDNVFAGPLLVLATAKQGTDQHQLGSIRCQPLTYHPSQLECINS